MKRSALNILDWFSESRGFEEYDFLRGHLYLEALMSEILKLHLKKDKRRTFNEKIKALKFNRLIDEETYDTLDQINKLRNDMAHNLDFDFSYKRILKIIRLAKKAGAEFTDNIIDQNEEVLEHVYGYTGAMKELFFNVFELLIYSNPSLFGEDEGVSYMS